MYITSFPGRNSRVFIAQAALQATTSDKSWGLACFRARDLLHPGKLVCTWPAPKENWSDFMNKMHLNFVETGEILGCGRSTVYKLVNAGLLTRIKIGARALIPVTDIERYAASLRGAA